MIFASDNWAGAHPSIHENLARHASGFAAAYGNSDLDRLVEHRLCQVFERDVAVYFVATGTAANALAMAAVNRPAGIAFCHRDAHMVQDEAGAVEFLASGSRLHPVDGDHGRIDLDRLARAIDRYPPGSVHAGQPMAVSITQATEIGTVYQLEEIGAIGATCRRHGLPLHMDGARFANALVSLEATPAQMTWKQGVDILSFGATKNGCWCAEAIVFMKPAMAEQFPYIRKRSAQLLSKSRFVAAQFEAYLEGGLWLDLARHANDMAARLARQATALGQARLAWEPGANEIFLIMERDMMQRLTAKGAAIHEWPMPAFCDISLAPGEVLCRLVTSFATTADHIDALCDCLQ